MERWKTLSRQDPEFLKYLDGTFSKSHIALPKRSMNVATVREEVTFEIIPVGEVQKPSLVQVFLTIARPVSVVLSLGPVVACWFYARVEGHPLDQNLAYACLLGIMFFHLGMNFLDDYFDHRRGIDRVNPRSGSRAIQNGWVRGRKMYHAGLGLLGLAVLCGLPVVLGQPLLLLGAALFALFVGWGFSSQTARLKYRGLGEVTTFLLSGPLLTVGFVWATRGLVTRPIFFLGCSFGFATVLYYHLKNIENIMIDSQGEARTLASRLGFDRAKQLYWFLGALSGISILLFDWSAGTKGLFAIVFAMQALLIWFVGRKLARTPSPLSSSLVSVRQLGLLIHWVTSAAFIFLLIGLWLMPSGTT